MVPALARADHRQENTISQMRCGGILSASPACRWLAPLFPVLWEIRFRETPIPSIGSGEHATETLQARMRQTCVRHCNPKSVLAAARSRSAMSSASVSSTNFRSGESEVPATSPEADTCRPSHKFYGSRPSHRLETSSDSQHCHTIRYPCCYLTMSIHLRHCPTALSTSSRLSPVASNLNAQRP